MAIAADRKLEIAKQYATEAGDTGSPQVQVALLTEHIKNLTEHLKVHKKDYASRTGLLLMVGKRSKLLKYLKRKSPQGYADLIQSLGLRR